MTNASPQERVEFLRRQRQTRAFTGEPVGEADLETILEVARWTGSAGNVMDCAWTT